MPEEEPQQVNERKVDQVIDAARNMADDHSGGGGPADTLRAAYENLSRDEKALFFQRLMNEFETPPSTFAPLLEQAILQKEASEAWTRALSDIRKHIDSPRRKLFRQFMDLPEGLPFLLTMRRDLLAIQRRDNIDLKPVDRELSALFDSWFQNNFLSLEEVTAASPYRLIRYLKDHELVHPMTQLEEMGRRLGTDRRCFALFHRVMPDVPIVFIEVALTRGLTRNIDDIILSKPLIPEKDANTAVFYSINNTQDGLAGIGLGNVLIFLVVDRIRQNLPQIENFATLSPLPGFWPRYLRRILTEKETPFNLTRDDLLNLFSSRAAETLTAERQKRAGRTEKDFAAVLTAILSDPSWPENEVYARRLERPLTELAYHYIVREKSARGRPVNPVANFHLSNGASISKSNINFLANTSERGLQESCGMMANYIYTQTWFRQLRRSVRAFISS